MIRHHWRHLTVAGIAVIAIGSASLKAQQRPRDLFERARILEESNQDLKQAIKLYEQAAAQAKSDRHLAATAYLHIAACYEKLGDKESRQVYLRILNEFSDQKDAAAEAGARLASFYVQDNITLATGSQPSEPQKMQLAWFDRTGKLIEKIGTPEVYRGLDLSRDGKRLAVHRHQGKGGDVWIFDLGTGAMSQLTHDATGAQDNAMPIWSPDGTHIAFRSVRTGKDGLYVKRADGTGGEELLLESEAGTTPMSWSPDGKFLVYWTNYGAEDQWVLPLTGDRKPFPILETVSLELHPQISPDGKWMAYMSNETGQNEIFIKQFPRGEGKWRVSSGGGYWPRWRGDGKELFFMTTNSSGALRTLMAVDLRPTATSVQFGAPHRLFDPLIPVVADGTDRRYHTYAVSPDGKRFLIATPPAQPTTPRGGSR